jgi:hypothetical protein
VIIDFMPLSAPIAKVNNGVLDIFGMLGFIGTKKRGECEGMECLTDV